MFGKNTYQITRLFGSSNSIRGMLVRGAFGSIFVKIATVALGFILSVVLARTLGAEGYGTYTYVYALILVLAVVAQFGLPSLIVRETAKADVNKSWLYIRSLWKSAGLATLLISIFFMMLIIFGVHCLPIIDDSPDKLTAMTWGAVLIPLIALNGIRGAALRGMNRVVQGQLPDDVLRPAFLLLSVTMIVQVSNLSLTAADVMLLHAISASLAFAIGVRLLHRAMPKIAAENETAPYAVVRCFISALPLASIALMQLLTTQTDILMLGFFVDSEQIGIYSIALKMSTLTSFGMLALAVVVLPYFSKFHVAGDIKRFRRLATSVARAGFLLALVPAVVFVVFGEQVLLLVFGKEYVFAYLPLVILAIGNLFHVAFGLVGPLLNMTGNEKDTAKGVAVAAICNFTLNLIFIPMLGISGAALATSLSLIIWNIVLWIAVKRRLHIDSSVLNRFHALRAG